MFISFRGKFLRKNFVSYLKEELKRSKINFFIDEDEMRGRWIVIFFEIIRELGVVFIFLLNKYFDLEWCLDEFVEIKK